MFILALDLAATTGIAFGAVGETPRCATWRLRGECRGARGQHLVGRLLDLFDTFGLPEAVYIEEPMRPSSGARRISQFTTLMSLYGLANIAETTCFARGVRTEMVGTQAVRLHFVGAARHKQKNGGKVACLHRAELLGWPVSDLDQADALALWDYACAKERPQEWALHAAARPALIRVRPGKPRKTRKGGK